MKNSTGRQWFRAYPEMRTDPKILMLGEADRWNFVVVLMLKCDGTLDHEDQDFKEKLVAAALGKTFEEAQELKKRLLSVYLIDETWHPVAWEKRQFISDDSKERVRKYRKNTKTSENVTANGRYSNGDVTLHGRYMAVTVTPPEADTETEAEAEDRGSSKPRTNEFSSVKKISSSSRENYENEHQCRIHAKSRKTDTGANGKQNDTFQDSRLLNFERILRRYHQHLPDLHSVRSMSPERQALMDSLVAGPLPHLGDWSDYFRRVGRSDFLMGRKVNGKKPFRASFNWLLRPEVVESVMEGKYDN